MWDAVRLAGDSALLLDFGSVVTPEANDRVLRVSHTLEKNKLEGIVGLVPAFATLLIEYDPTSTSAETLIEELCRLQYPQSVGDSRRTFEIPVHYGGEQGPDLVTVAQRLGLTADEVISLHANHAYRIYCLGFAPGFPLAGLLPERLRLPRRAVPRTAVYSGAVAIAGAQTGIYPLATPGGWHLIGHTPVPLFDWRATPPSVYGPGDALIFRAVSWEEYSELMEDRRRGELQIREVAR